jgi:ribonuclease R
MTTADSKRIVSGRVDVHPRGFGFLTVHPADANEVLTAFIPPPELNPFFADDLVSATITAGADGRWSASGLKLLERARQHVFGEVVIRNGKTLLRVDREVGNTDWPLDGGDESLLAGDAAIARIGPKRLTLQKRIPAETDHSLARVMARHELQREFGEELLRTATAAQAKPHALGARRDLRGIPTVTVDAPSTRDIDDAISILPASSDGAIRLFVSIADVAEFVDEGSPLDHAAQARGTSVYLANTVLPMLPEELSTNWLSLVPGEERSCLTVELRIDAQGRITAADVYESLIKSWARLNYTEVAAFLDEGIVSGAMETARDAMPWFRAASARLAVARAARGGMELARDEARLTFDEATGEVSGIEPVKSTSAHAMIERFMVAANEAIAQWLHTRGVPVVYRVQEQPDPQDIADLEAFAMHSGFATAFGPELTPIALAAFDRQIAGSLAEPALRSVLRRSLGYARYTVQPLMHFGLAAPLYLHFTSPIRRYADLAVHRTIKKYLHGRRDFVPNDPQVETLAVHLNERNRAASKAENERRRMLEAQLMSERIGETFAGRVVRVKPFGMTVQLDGTLVEGVVAAEALPNGPYKTDARQTALIGPGRSFGVGAPLRVKVVAADDVLGRIDLALAE